MPWELTGNPDATATSFLGSTNAQPLIIRAGSSPSPQPPERLRITTDGRIGIGTAAPQARLSIAGGGAIVNNVAIGTDSANVNYPNEADTIGLGSPETSGILRQLRLQSPNGLTFHTGAPGVTPEANQRLTVTSDGRVGVGTTAPGAAYRLDVSGVLNATDYHKNGAPLVSSQWTEVSDGITYPAGNVGIGTAPGANYRLDVGGALNATDIHKNGTPVVSSQWSSIAGGISYAGGNVSIGTASPGAKLSVVGGGATVNGVAVGTDVPGIDYPWEYETIGVTQTNFNLRLQSPNAIVFHTGDVPTDRMMLTEDGDLVIRKFPANDTTPSLTRLGLINRSAGGNELQWALYTAAVGGGWGVNPNAFEIWEYPATQTRFQIRSGGSTILVPAGGNVGVGTTTPGAKLSVVGGGATVNGVTVGTDVPGIDYPWEYESVGVTNTAFNLRLQSPNWIFFHTGDALSQRWGLSEAGDWVKTSSRDLKENIADFTAREAVGALAELKPVTYSWTDDRERKTRLGFIAEDTPAIATTPDKMAIIPFNILTILTRAVQEQQRMIHDQQEAIDSLRRRPDPGTAPRTVSEDRYEAADRRSQEVGH